MPKRRSHPYSTRRRARAGAERRDRLREAAANWMAGEYDTPGGERLEAEDDTTLNAVAGEQSLEILIAGYGLTDPAPASGPGRVPTTRARRPRALPARGVTRQDGRAPAVSFHPNRETVEAIMKAAAMIACADGHVSPIERLTLLSFLGRHGILAREGRAASSAAFDQAVREAGAMRLDQACAAADSLRSIAGRPGAPMVANAAAVVALADGIGWPQELALLEVIRDRLGLRYGHQTRPGMAET